MNDEPLLVFVRPINKVRVSDGIDILNADDWQTDGVF
jgi:hypothetical protein